MFWLLIFHIIFCDQSDIYKPSLLILTIIFFVIMTYDTNHISVNIDSIQRDQSSNQVEFSKKNWM